MSKLWVFLLMTHCLFTTLNAQSQGGENKPDKPPDKGDEAIDKDKTKHPMDQNPLGSQSSNGPSSSPGEKGSDPLESLMENAGRPQQTTAAPPKQTSADPLEGLLENAGAQSGPQQTTSAPPQQATTAAPPASTSAPPQGGANQSAPPGGASKNKKNGLYKWAGNKLKSLGKKKMKQQAQQGQSPSPQQGQGQGQQQQEAQDIGKLLQQSQEG